MSRNREGIGLCTGLPMGFIVPIVEKGVRLGGTANRRELAKQIGRLTNRSVTEVREDPARCRREGNPRADNAPGDALVVTGAAKHVL